MPIELSPGVPALWRHTPMGMAEVNEDWQVVKLRFEAWWQGEVYDRPLFSVTSPRDGASAPPRAGAAFVAELPDEQIQAQWTDIDVILRK